jgi:hypothetical protein
MGGREADWFLPWAIGKEDLRAAMSEVGLARGEEKTENGEAARTSLDFEPGFGRTRRPARASATPDFVIRPVFFR